MIRRQIGAFEKLLYRLLSSRQQGKAVSPVAVYELLVHVENGIVPVISLETLHTPSHGDSGSGVVIAGGGQDADNVIDGQLRPG